MPQVDPPEFKPGEPSKDDTFNYKRDSVKTLRQIGRESAERMKKAKKDKEPKKDDEVEVKEDKVIEETPEQKERKEEKLEEAPAVQEPKVDVEAAVKRASEETAARVKEETSKEFQAKIDEILNKDKDIQEKQKEADELVASWDKEKRLPKDYQELISETMRISDVKMEQRLRTQRNEEAKKRDEVEKERVAKETTTKTEEARKLEDFNKAIASDLDEIYNAKLLPRPSKIEEINNPDTTDKNAKETQKVLQFGIELNQRLVKEGKPPVTSLSKIYFLHYQPTISKAPKKEEQPAGADAPIAGGRNTPSGEDSAKIISYTQLHNETWAQTKMRLAREATRRLLNK